MDPFNCIRCVSYVSFAPLLLFITSVLFTKHLAVLCRAQSFVKVSLPRRSDATVTRFNSISQSSEFCAANEMARTLESKCFIVYIKADFVFVIQTCDLYIKTEVIHQRHLHLFFSVFFSFVLYELQQPDIPSNINNNNENHRFLFRVM